MNNHYILGKDILTIIVKEFSGKTVGSEECNMESIMNYFFPQNKEKVEVEINKKKVVSLIRILLMYLKDMSKF